VGRNARRRKGWKWCFGGLPGLSARRRRTELDRISELPKGEEVKTYSAGGYFRVTLKKMGKVFQSIWRTPEGKQVHQEMFQPVE